MNYYLVDYIVLENKNVIINDRIGITLHSFGNLRDFRNIIAKIWQNPPNTDSIVIKSYQQVYKEEYYELTAVLQ